MTLSSTLTAGIEKLTPQHAHCALHRWQMRSSLQFLFLGLCFCKLGVAILIATAVALPNWWET